MSAATETVARRRALVLEALEYRPATVNELRRYVGCSLEEASRTVQALAAEGAVVKVRGTVPVRWTVAP